MRNRRLLIAATAVTLAVLGACGQNNGRTSATDFTGPYASEFKRNYEEVDNKLVKGILQDSQITDTEFEEFKDTYTSCLEQYDVQWQYLDGQGEQFNPIGKADLSQDDINKATDACQIETGYMYIVPLYDSLHNNPDNLSSDDLSQLSLSCLEKYGFIQQGTTLQEYKDILNDPDKYQSVFGAYEDSASPNYQQFYSCIADPVNAE